MQRINTEKILWLVCFFLIWAGFLISASNFIDPDFGWQFKTGEWIWENKQVPHKDLFSYSMPNYAWQAHSWLSQVFIFLGYSKLGYLGLGLIFSFIGALSLSLWLRPKKIYYAIIPLFLAALSILEHIAIRPRLISFLLAAVLFYLLRKSYQNSRWLLFLPLLFFAWVNLHGGFVIGFQILFLALLIDLFLFLKDKKQDLNHFKWLFSLSVISGIVTLINPYNWYLYQVIFKEIFLSQEAHSKIVEWFPYSSFNLAVFIYISVFLVLAKFFKKKLNLFEIIISIILLLMGFLSQRFMPYFFVFTLPLMVNLLEVAYLFLKNQKNFLKIWSWRKWALILFIVFVLVSFSWKTYFHQGLTESNYYPQEAINFLDQQKISGNIFSTYNWGGYLIWKMPKHKVFVDGRMAIWEENGYSAFKQELAIHEGEIDYQEVFNHHLIKTVLLPIKNEKEDILVKKIRELLKLERTDFVLSDELIKDDWKIVYQDSIAQVLVKP